MSEGFEAEGARGDLRFGTIPNVLALGAVEHGSRVALEEGDVRLTYAELDARVVETARGFVAMGLAPGDRVGVWAPNSWRWAVTALGALAAGGVLVPINTRYKGPEAAYVLQKSRARALVVAEGFLGASYLSWLADAGVDLGALAIASIGDDPGPRGVTLEALVARGERVDAAEIARRRRALSPDDPCDLLFTSGTTGRPKGVVCTHAQSLRAFFDWAQIVGLRAGDRYLVVPPFFHTFGYKAGLLASLMTGATVLPHAAFDAGAVLARVAVDRVGVIPGPPALYQSLLAHPDLAATDRSTLRLAVTGAAVIPVELVERMKRELGFETVLTAYGLTEATGVATMCRRGDSAETVATTSGRAIPGVEVRVVGDDGVEVPRGAPGELVVRGYTVTRGYFEDDAATRDAVDAEGYLHTGDVAVMDEQGNIRITDRKKDMFIVGGFNAYPAEIEQAIAKHPAVGDVAVVGMADERLGEVGAAFVVRRAGVDATEAEIIAFCRENMANYKVPRRVCFVDALPRNASGKVLKFELRAALATRPT